MLESLPSLAAVRLGASGQYAGAIVGGAVNSAVTQGIGVAMGWQDKFSWAGVAAAGVSAGVGHGLGEAFTPKPFTGPNADF